MNFQFTGPPRPISAAILKEQPGKHFYLTPEGNEYPSITTVLSYNPKPWLDEWRDSIGHVKADKITEKAGIRGTGMHLLFNNYLRNIPLDPSSLPPWSMKLFRLARPYLNRVSNIRLLETPLYSDRLKVAGTVDCVAEYEKILSVVDFKSSTRVKTKEQITDYFSQATAYSIMYEERTGEPIDNIVLIISVEESLSPLVFKGTIDKYIKEIFNSLRNYRKRTESGT